MMVKDLTILFLAIHILKRCVSRTTLYERKESFFDRWLKGQNLHFVHDQIFLPVTKGLTGLLINNVTVSRQSRMVLTASL